MQSASLHLTCVLFILNYAAYSKSYSLNSQSSKDSPEYKYGMPGMPGMPDDEVQKPKKESTTAAQSQKFVSNEVEENITEPIIPDPDESKRDEIKMPGAAPKPGAPGDLSAANVISPQDLKPGQMLATKSNKGSQQFVRIVGENVSNNFFISL